MHVGAACWVQSADAAAMKRATIMLIRMLGFSGQVRGK